MTFYSPDCLDEYNYLYSCNSEYSVSQYGGLQWPQLRGAVYVEFCQTVICMSDNATQELYIQTNQFTSNRAGPILDISQSSTASQLFIVGGRDVLVSDSLFSDNKGDLYMFDQMDTLKLT